ncbi:hypothetical protein NQD34_011606 [Periophthalmus magnuspinnatus]|nr:hypothetical protein NQD34_011606 [Periophthalmus magnuspinnatus]
MESIELVQCSTTRTKKTLLLLNLRFDYRSDSPLQYPGVDLTGKAEECDSAVIGTHPPVPLLIQRDHHPGLPFHRYCPRPPRDVAETCQPRQTHNIQRLEVLRTDLIHPRSLATEELANHLSDFSQGDGRVRLRVPSFMATYLSQEQLKLVPLLTLLFCLGRLVYWVAAVFQSSIRAFGFGLSFLPSLAMIAANLYFLVTMEMSGGAFSPPQKEQAPPQGRQRFWG